MRPYRAILTILLAGVLAACGGDDDGGDGAGDDGGGDGVDSDTLLSELSAEDAQVLCEEVDDLLTEAAADLQTIICYGAAVLAGDDCQSQADQCLDQSLEDIPVDCGISEGTEVTTCSDDVTVGDFQACFEVWTGLWSTLADAATCDSDPEDFGDGLVPPDECLTLFESCPDLPMPEDG